MGFCYAISWLFWSLTHTLLFHHLPNLVHRFQFKLHPGADILQAHWATPESRAAIYCLRGSADTWLFPILGNRRTIVTLWRDFKTQNIQCMVVATGNKIL